LAKLTPRPTKRVLAALQRAGWRLREKEGARHYVLVHAGLPGIVTVPRHAMTRKKTLGLIIKQAGLTLSQFEALYR
jgi:predicted RNA binding protein YcfA (HicA-like mRNA interferase family)